MFTLGYRNRNECIIRAILAIVLGVVLLVNGSFAAWIVKVVVGVLMAIAILQLLVFGSIKAHAQLDLGSIFSSALVILVAAILLFNPFSLALMRIIAGICLILYGINELRSTPKVNAAIRQLRPPRRRQRSGRTVAPHPRCALAATSRPLLCLRRCSLSAPGTYSIRPGVCIF